MKIDIITEGLTLNLFGLQAIAINKDYAGTAFKLMGSVWQMVKEQGLKHKGKNIWVYEPEEKVFVGLELMEVPSDTPLTQKEIRLNKYAYHKHFGPYHLIKTAGQNMVNELRAKGFETCLPYVEIYGHWTNDESKLETELFMSLAPKSL